MQGIDAKSAVMLSGAVARLGDTREALDRAGDDDRRQQARVRRLKDAVRQVKGEAAKHTTSAQELLRVLQDLNAKNAKLRERNVLLRGVTRQVSVASTLERSESSAGAAALASLEEQLVQAEARREQLAVLVVSAEQQLADKKEALTAAKRELALETLAHRQAACTTDRLALNNMTLQAALE